MTSSSETPALLWCEKASGCSTSDTKCQAGTSAVDLDCKQHFVTGKNILITGCTSSLGEAFVHLIADLRPNKIFLAVQSNRRGRFLQEELAHKNVKSELLRGDMGSIAGAQRIADAMLATKEPLHIIFWNAIVWEALQGCTSKVAREEYCEPGYYSHFVTNYLSMVIVCTTLKPLLEQSAPSRIVITGCSTHMDVAKGNATLDEQIFDPPHLQNQKTANLPPKDEAYAQTKLLQYMWAKKFATTLGPEVAIMVYNPGQCKRKTQDMVPNILKKMIGEYGESLYNSITGLRTPEDSAAVALWCADNPAAASANGKYIDFGILGSPKINPPCELGFSPSHNASSHSIMDPMQVERLWTLTLKFLKWQCVYHQHLHLHCDAETSQQAQKRAEHEKLVKWSKSKHRNMKRGELTIISESETLPNLLTSKPFSSQQDKSNLIEL